MSSYLEKKTFFVITGASRGIGKTMAIEVSKKLSAASIVVLIARNAEGLKKTKAEIDCLGKAIHVQTYSVDLESELNESHFEEILKKSLTTAELDVADFERALIIHNAGTVGDVSKRAREASDAKEWQQYFHMNLFSAVVLNCAFLKLFIHTPKIVVNVSSKCGVEPFESMSFYCAGKAARDMYFRVLAKEEEREKVLVLNYAPGPIDTDMSVQVQSSTLNKELSNSFREMRETKKMLTTQQTTAKFIEVLEEQKYNSGDHVDYFD